MKREMSRYSCDASKHILPSPGGSAAPSCPTLCDPKDCRPPGSSVHGALGQEYWSGQPGPPPGALPDRGTEPVPLASPALAGGFLSAGVTGEALPRENLRNFPTATIS